ncbi:unnamed protein product, partial [Durusdinium trenchii]
TTSFSNDQPIRLAMGRTDGGRGFFAWTPRWTPRVAATCCCLLVPFSAFSFVPHFNLPGALDGRGLRRGTVRRASESLRDWRDFRAKLVQGSRKTTGLGTRESSGWAYSTDLLEQGSVLLSVPGDYWALRRQYFAKVVMLIVDHHEKGTVGVVLNRPTQLTAADLDLSESELFTDSLFQFFGLTQGLKDWKVWFGGDCEGLECAEKGERPRHFCLHTLERFAGNSNRVMKGIYIMNFRQAKFLVVTGQAKKEDFMLVVGYTGWSRGQLQDELNRGDSWVLGAADPARLLGSEELPLQERLEQLSAREEGEVNDLGDGVQAWSRLYETLRLDCPRDLDGDRQPEESEDEEEEAHNSQMIRRWVDAYLRPPLKEHPAPLTGTVEAGSILRGSATAWALGRPEGSWPSRSRDPWMVPGQYLHKAVLVLLADCSPTDPAPLVLLNGPCIGHTAEGHEVFFGGPGVAQEARCVVPLPRGAVLGRFTLPPGVLHELLGSQALEEAKLARMGELMDLPRSERWLGAGGKLESLNAVKMSLEGDRQQKKWYKEYLGITDDH